MAAVFDFPARGLTVDDRLEARTSSTSRTISCYPPDHWIAGKRRITIADLRDEDRLSPMLGPDSPSQKVFTAACGAEGYEPRIVFRVNNCEMYRALSRPASGSVSGCGSRCVRSTQMWSSSPSPKRPGGGSRLSPCPALTRVAEVFLGLLEEYAAAYPTSKGPART